MLPDRLTPGSLLPKQHHQSDTHNSNGTLLNWGGFTKHISSIIKRLENRCGSEKSASVYQREDYRTI